MMFPAARFRERVKWTTLGTRLTDDNALGLALIASALGWLAAYRCPLILS
jgi:hypothetical protein